MRWDNIEINTPSTSTGQAGNEPVHYEPGRTYLYRNKVTENEVSISLNVYLQ